MSRRTAPSRTEWKLAELAQDAGVSARTVRYYVQRGLLPPPVFRGADTAYGRDHLLRLKVIQRLQDAYLPLDVIQERLGSLGLAELETLAEGAPPSAAASASAPTRGADTPAERPAQRPSTLWERWTAAPGLEIHVSSGASAEVRALAERFLAECRARTKGERS